LAQRLWDCFWRRRLPLALTYHVNADCTGFKFATLSIGPTVDFDFVLDDSAREIRMIVSDDGFAVSGSARSLDTHSKSRE